MLRQRATRLTLAMALIAVIAMSAAAVTARIALAGGGGCHEPTSDASGTHVDLKGICFWPTVLHVAEGDIVTWTNREDVAHTVTGSNRAWGTFDQLTQGQSVSQRFDANGVYPYYCLLHPGMVGAVVVGDGSGPGAAGHGADAPLGVTSAGSGSDSPQFASGVGGVGPQRFSSSEAAGGRSDGVSVGLIAGASGAGAMALVMLAGAVVYVRRRRVSAPAGR